MKTKEPITDMMKRYADWLRWTRDERANGFTGLLMPYQGATEDAVHIADYATDVLPKVLALCQRHAHPGVNTGAHALAVKVMHLIEELEGFDPDAIQQSLLSDSPEGR